MTKERVRLKYKRTDLYHINPHDIVITEELKKLNPRYMFDDSIEELADSIQQNGVKKPIKVFFREDGRPVLVHGFRRIYAVTLANKRNGIKIETIPAMAVRKTISHQDILLEHFVNNDSVPLKPIEQAKGFKQFVDWGWDIKEIGKKIGRSAGYVKDKLILLDGNPDLQKAVNTQKISTGLANQIIKNSGSDKEKEKSLTQQASSGKKGKKAVKDKLNGKKKSSKETLNKILALDDFGTFAVDNTHHAAYLYGRASVENKDIESNDRDFKFNFTTVLKRREVL